MTLTSGWRTAASSATARDTSIASTRRKRSPSTRARPSPTASSKRSVFSTRSALFGSHRSSRRRLTSSPYARRKRWRRVRGSSESALSHLPSCSAIVPRGTLASRLVSLDHVLVVGAGQMGAGIAQVAAASGRRVSLHDAAPGAVERGLETMRKSLARLAEKGGPAPDEVLPRVEPVEDLVSADLMIEAVVEDAAVKEEVFGRADEVLPPQAILASNTSSIPISSLAAATSRPDRVIGMHFFNPVPVLKLVEIVRGRETSDETVAAIVDLAEELGKTPAEAND